jgi:hypothetical protein
VHPLRPANSAPFEEASTTTLQLNQPNSDQLDLIVTGLPAADFQSHLVMKTGIQPCLPDHPKRYNAPQAVAFCMGLHPQLGKTSSVYTLNNTLVQVCTT